MSSPPTNLDPGALALLPEPDHTPRCADHARSIHADPGGTAITADLVVVVDVPLPWPKPVFDHDHLAGLRGTGPSAGGPMRLLASVPDDPDRRRVRTYRRRGGRAERTVHEPPDDTARRSLLEALASVEPADLPWSVHTDEPETTVLVCTQGSHDVCCGTEGTRLARELSELDRDDLTVLRVSHTGGHRFAPTAMTLPDGRMWAHLDLATLVGITGRRLPTERVASRCRGWWGATTGPAQVAERAVFAHAGWEWNDTHRTVTELTDGSGDGTTTWRVAGDAGEWIVELEPGRPVPTITCRADGGLPAKPGREYTVTAVRPLP